MGAGQGKPGQIQNQRGLSLQRGDRSKGFFDQMNFGEL